MNKKDTMEPSPSSELDAINIIGHDMRSLVKKIQELRHIGIEDNKIALPKICVIGDQSTGKSSLIEGMSEIKVPRSAGTCTRCPMEINLSESEPGQPWTCRVYLSRKYMFDGSQKITKIPRRSNPLGPWIEQDQEDELFTTITEKGDVQEAIKWAQLAVLNPSHPPSDYIPGQNAATGLHQQVKFSPNVVRLDISSSNFPNLSFYDLPGVISQAEFDEERYLVSLVENLVKDYISQSNCIVLLTLPMTDDATNSSAARLMRDVRGANSRTLGVLTKPDRIQTGESYEQWIEILEGDKFRLGHGYYVVRNNPDPDIEHSRAREEEAAFFASNPWSTDLTAYQGRFGTRNLQTALSSLLLEQIQDCLPSIIEKIEEKANRIERELSTLPVPLSGNIPYILCGKMNQLKEEIRSHIDGGSSQYPLQKRWGRIAVDFKRALTKTRPIVQILTEREKKMYLDEDDDDSDCYELNSQRPVKRLRTSVTAPLPSTETKPSKSPAPKQSGYNFTCFEMFDKPAKMFTWDEIREFNEDSCRAGIPDQIDPRTVEILNQKSVEHWSKPMEVFLHTTHYLVRDMLMQQLETVFAQYHQTSLYRELRKIMESYLQKLKTEHFQHAEETYAIEHNKPFTMATSALEQARNESYKLLATRRRDARIDCYLRNKRKIVPTEPRWDAEWKKVTDAELKVDQYPQEVRAMAVCLTPFLACSVN